jgi:hypothetical protein
MAREGSRRARSRGSNSVADRWWVTTVEVRRLKHTASSIGALGDDARQDAIARRLAERRLDSLGEDGRSVALSMILPIASWRSGAIERRMRTPKRDLLNFFCTIKPLAQQRKDMQREPLHAPAIAE